MSRSRTKIDDQRRTKSFSKRATLNLLKVEKGKCPFCRHEKIFVGSIKKCCKCKKVLK